MSGPLVTASFSVSGGQQRVVEFKPNTDSANRSAATESYSYTGRKDGGQLPEPKQSPYLDLATALEVRTAHFYNLYATY
jgi:hypothetical protein